MNTIKNIYKSAIMGIKSRLFSSIFAGIIIAVCLLGTMFPQATIADSASPAIASYVIKSTNDPYKTTKTIKVVITAYSSTPDQTDDTPFITASGKSVGDGIIANNLLPFGTKIKIPSIYGDKVFVVEDRMATYKGKYHVDIWMPTRNSALKFGVKTAEIQVLQS